ncbi:MAG TPA: hypothetical protein VF671_13370 [Pseudomonas sp.]|jgi:hypothetical protein|uniref:hypothetical protein n=1 Tax=Pseudomonas sp. TaxID=306 RepID=UPI002EDB0C4C
MDKDTEHQSLVNEVAVRVIEMLEANKATEALAQLELAAVYRTALEGIYIRYPFLNADSPEVNQVALAEAVSLTQSLIAEGTANTEALLIAVGRIGPKYDSAALH